MKRYEKIIAFSALTLMFVAFQNFSKVNEASTLNNLGPGPSSPDYPIDDVFRDPYTPSQLPAFTCKSVIELQPPAVGNLLHVPARDSSGVCYTLKIINPSRFSPSSINTLLDLDVVSRNHDNGYSDPTKIRHPYVLGESSFGLYLEGERSLKLAGGNSATTGISVDNFILVGLSPIAQLGNPFYYLAYGTKDSTVGDLTGVLFNDQTVPLTAYAVGGTSLVPPLNLDNKVSSKVNYALDVRALDCGGVGTVSNIYVLFQ